VISVLGICGIRIAWIYTIFQVPRFHSIDVLFASYPISWAITYAAQLFAFLLIFNKFRREHGITSLKAQ